VLKILTFSSLYPNERQPRHGIFVEQRLRRLIETGKVTARVLAPVPWFPFKARIFGRYATLAAVPRRELRHNIVVAHPRYPVVPKIGMTAAPILMAQALRPVVRSIIRSGYDFDLIDAHYCYPDGVAAAMIANTLSKPVIITGRGDDIALIPEYRAPRRMILKAIERAAAVVTVSADLKRQLQARGVDSEKITTLRNGVDLELFRPLDRKAARQKVGFNNRTLVSVGHLIERKGHHIAISALAELPEFTLVIIGEGKLKQPLQQQARRLGVVDRVRFLANRSQEDLPVYYSAADALILPTDREGMPNVVLEAMACGCPVVATAVSGIPEIMTTPEAGVFMDERTPEAAAAAVQTLFQHLPRRNETRRHAETLGWEQTTRGQIELFERVLTQTAKVVNSPQCGADRNRRTQECRW
jgi:glycosyltransferase involved in cell wall biosynthesis